jgi:hypothetical protein
MALSKHPTALARAAALTAAPPTSLAGQIMRAIHGELLQQIGENATPAQRILTQMAAVKATRCALWERKILDDADPTVDDQVRWLAWSNSTRADLAALGITQKSVNSMTPEPMLPVCSSELRYYVSSYLPNSE